MKRTIFAFDKLTLRVENLDKKFKELVNKISIQVKEEEIVSLVGESGSGKTLTALSTVGLLPPGIKAIGNAKWINEPYDINDNHFLQKLRGKEIGFIFQEPLISLNPLHTIGKQIEECLKTHNSVNKENLKASTITLLQSVKLSDAEKRINFYPHQLSGGQRQRVMIAMAISNNPKLLIADEPTTALDVTVQKEILDLLYHLKKEKNLSILFITHNLSLVKKFSDRLYVMKNGSIVEEGLTKRVFENPKHNYTKKLLSSKIDIKLNKSPLADPILKVRDLSVIYSLKKGLLRRNVFDLKAVDNVSLSLSKGETLGLVGESGCGKTTLAYSLLNLNRFLGKIIYEGKELGHLRGKNLKRYRRNIQIVFQDPFSSLSPRFSIRDIVGEGIKAHRLLSGKELNKEIEKVIDKVGLDVGILNRYPHEFSGGQRQRIAIARVLIMKPKILILDEPTSSLDVTIQKQIIELLLKLQNEMSLSYLFISHDLNLVSKISHRILVMKDGKVVEQGNTIDIMNKPKNVYTKTLINSTLNKMV